MAKPITSLQSTNTLGSDDQMFMRQGNFDRRISAELMGTLSWAKREGYTHLGTHAVGISFPDTESFTTYQGKVYFVNKGVTLPYLSTSTDASIETDLHAKTIKSSVGELTNLQAASVADMLAGKPVGWQSGDPVVALTLNQRWIVDDYYGGATPNNSGVLFFKVVAAGTGTADEGKYIDASGGLFQFEQIMKLTPSVKDFGARGLAGGDDTASFEECRDYIASKKGGIALLGDGVFPLNNFVIDSRGVLFQGGNSGNRYSQEDSNSTITNVAGATFATRLKGSSSEWVTNASEGSGFRNVQITASGGCDYGCFIDGGATILENVQITKFVYNCVIADGANANIFNDCNFLLAKQVNFLVNEHQANSFMHPDITDLTNFSNTTFYMNRCNWRQSENFGMIIRSAVNPTFNDCVGESNKQAGIFLYRTDVSTMRGLDFNNVWLENNYEDYTTGSTSYSIIGNRALLESAGVYIPWTSIEYAGYQYVESSQTKTGTGGCDTITWNGGTIAAANALSDQKGILILSGYNTIFNRPWLTGGNLSEFIRVAPNAAGATFNKPIQGNDPSALVPSLITPVDGQLGTGGKYIRPDFYIESDQDVGIRVGSSTPFTIDTQETFITKVGRTVHVDINATVTGNLLASTAERLWITDLPYYTSRVESLAGSCWVRSTGGGASTLNDGESQMYFVTTNGAYTTKDIFNTVNTGHTFDIRVNLTYTTTQ